MMKSPAVPPLAVANQFLKRSCRSHTGCQKLTYLAYGHYLNKTGQLLTNERPLAWQNGPAFYTLYMTMTAAGNNLIAGPIPDSMGHVQLVPEDDLEYPMIEEYVMRRYGGLSDQQLSDICMIQGSAWQNLMNANVQARSQTTAIPDDMVKAAFRLH